VNPHLVAALDYARRGWPVLPCKPHGKIPLTRHGLHDASTDPDQFHQWWGRWPTANVGLATGLAFDVLDVDGPEGLDSLPKHLDAGDTVDGPTVVTGTGWHVYVTPTGHGNRAGILPHVDWRGAGGYVIAPPSVHPSGARYRWELPDDPRFGSRAPIRPAPAWLVELLDPPRRSPYEALRDRMASDWPAAARHPVSASYGQRALESELGRLAVAPDGERNQTLHRSACRLGQLVRAGQLDAGQVVDALLAVGQRVGLDDREIEPTVRSGLKFGLEHPR
jgi:hypothetical protein